MRLYLDTEFNGFGGELISLGLIGLGTSWYGVREINSQLDPWVQQHVIPVLFSKPLPSDMFKSAFHSFIGSFKNPEIICDWHADAEHFCWLLAGHDYGSSLDFECRIVILNTPPNAYKSAIPHNALSDAEALMNWHYSSQRLVA